MKRGQPSDEIIPGSGLFLQIKDESARNVLTSALSLCHALIASKAVKPGAVIFHLMEDINRREGAFETLGPDYRAYTYALVELLERSYRIEREPPDPFHVKQPGAER